MTMQVKQKEREEAAKLFPNEEAAAQFSANTFQVVFFDADKHHRACFPTAG